MLHGSVAVRTVAHTPAASGFIPPLVIMVHGEDEVGRERVKGSEEEEEGANVEPWECVARVVFVCESARQDEAEG